MAADDLHHQKVELTSQQPDLEPSLKHFSDFIDMEKMLGILKSKRETLLGLNGSESQVNEKLKLMDIDIGRVDVKTATIEQLVKELRRWVKEIKMNTMTLNEEVEHEFAKFKKSVLRNQNKSMALQKLKFSYERYHR